MERKSLKFNTLEEAKAYIQEKFEEGTLCPCCGQNVKLYRYKLYDTSAAALIKLFQLTMLTKEEEHHISKFAEKTADTPRASHFAELRHWGLITKGSTEPEDPKKKKSAGFWSITEKGKEFVRGEIKVQDTIKMFNNEFYGFEGDRIDIHQALNNKFDYSDIMSGKTHRYQR